MSAGVAAHTVTEEAKRSVWRTMDAARKEHAALQAVYWPQLSEEGHQSQTPARMGSGDRFNSPR